MEKTAVLHELNGAIVDNTTTLRVGVHDSDLQSTVGVAHGDSRLDGVVVIVDCHFCVEGEVGTIVTDALLHLKTVGVSVEGVRIVESIKAPLGDDFAAFVVNNRDLEHLNFEFDDLGAFTEADESLIDSDVVGISVDDGEFTGHGAGLNLDRLELRVGVGSLVIHFRNEDVGAANLLVIATAWRWVVILKGELKALFSTVSTTAVGELRFTIRGLARVCESFVASLDLLGCVFFGTLGLLKFFG